MDVAERTSLLSHAKRLKVGTVIVKDDRIISCGYNGLPVGWEPNDCEYEITISDAKYQELSIEDKLRFYNVPAKPLYEIEGTSWFEFDVWKGLKTYEEVIHSEANAISRLASSTESGIDAILFCTHSPCLQCSKIIYGAGIKTVYYKTEYRSSDGINFLKKCGVEVIKYKGNINGEN